MNTTQNIPQNLRCLLWRSGVSQDQWPAQLAQWCACDVARATAMLQGQEELTEPETEAVATATGVQTKEWLSGNLLDGVDVLTENLKFLLDSLEHGGKNRLADSLGVTPGTVYKWCGGFQPPKKRHSQAILAFFGLDPLLDLTTQALFLSMEPIGSRAKREWLMSRLKGIDEQALEAYFPALKKILD